MFFNINFKFTLSIIAGILTVVSYIPYIISILNKKTKPHIYTWFIWAITQGTAAVAVVYGGGSFGSIALFVGTILVILIFSLSFKFGSKNITKNDTITLFIALFIILFWWISNNLYISIFLITLIDIIGYIPTIRKTYYNPYSEKIIFWLLMVIVNLLIIFSVTEYNFFTIIYVSMLLIMNFTMCILMILRRIHIKKS